LARDKQAKRSAVTLHDVAEAASVSVMTASNAIRGKDVVSDETRKRVMRAVARLNYRPNVTARSLRASASRSVGLVISDRNPAFLSDPFISQLVSGLSNFLSSVDYTLDIQGVSPDRFDSASILTKAGNDALCAILCGPKPLRLAHRRKLRSLGQPTVIFQESFMDRDGDTIAVRQDDEHGGRLIGQHLLGRGARKILFLRPELDWPAIEQREAGLRAALDEAHGRVACTTVLAPSESFADVKATVKAVFAAERADAIAAATDPMGIAAMRICEQSGLTVPGDVRVTGFNGFEAWQYATPTLTTVMSHAYEQGQRAGRVLVERLSTGRFAERNIVFPVELLEGQSS
jgi:LacI family transcriptional regulator